MNIKREDRTWPLDKEKGCRYGGSDREKTKLKHVVDVDRVVGRKSGKR
jgi:hypothetical protein